MSVHPMIGRAVVVDGGLATELEAHGHDLSDRLWSARLLLSDPDAIEAVHLAYFRAGAHIATTASYQASVPGFVAIGLDRAEALDLVRLSVHLADRARDAVRTERAEAEASAAGSEPEGGALASAAHPLLVAGSIGPYGAYLANGSEYRGDYDIGAAALADFHRPRMEAAVEAGADLLALETIPTIREAEVLVALLDDVGATAWLSYSCRDASTTSAGEPIEAAVALGSHPRILAIGVNCTAPRFVPELLERAGAATTAPLIAYPNSGDRWDPSTRTWGADDGGRYDPLTVATWSDLGASWLGGCCGTGPAQIRVLADAIAVRRAAA